MTDERLIFKPRVYPDLADIEESRPHRGACIWLTGLSASGKTSIAAALQHSLLELGLHGFALDGDILRAGLCQDLGFTPEDRRENVRRAGQVARLMVDAGLLVSCAFISPYRKGRAELRQMFAPQRFLECHVRCSLEVCERRDPKGLYARARSGELAQFTGISAPYEAPEKPDLVLDTSSQQRSPEDCAAEILELLHERGIIGL